jgi:hypothetical protein
MKKLKKILIGHCPIDSGSLVIVDPCYILKNRTKTENDKLYQDGINILLSKKYGEILYSNTNGKGIITTTFDGNGLYPIYAKIDENQLPHKIIIDLYPR